MPAFSVLHNELRLRSPEKPFEVYDDALRWAANHICVKTAQWQIVSTLLTVPGETIYDLDLPTGSAIHSNLYIIQKAPTSGGTDRIIRRPVNGFAVNTFGAPADWLQAFRTVAEDQIQIYPEPKDGGITLEVYTAIKPTSGAQSMDNNKIFNEYKDVLVQGALYRLYDIDEKIEASNRAAKTFRNGVSAIHIDVLKENANTPLKVSASW